MNSEKRPKESRRNFGILGQEEGGGKTTRGDDFFGVRPKNVSTKSAGMRINKQNKKKKKKKIGNAERVLP